MLHLRRGEIGLGGMISVIGGISYDSAQRPDARRTRASQLFPEYRAGLPIRGQAVCRTLSSCSRPAWRGAYPRVPALPVSRAEAGCEDSVATSSRAAVLLRQDAEAASHAGAPPVKLPAVLSRD